MAMEFLPCGGRRCAVLWDDVKPFDVYRHRLAA
jgi:hypothetical protein